MGQRYVLAMATFTMVEFPSTSAAASAAFMATVFWWTATPYGPDYTDVDCGGANLGFQQDPAEQPAAPLVIIQVDDLDVMQREVEAAGGIITVEPFDFPGGRRFHFREPGGNELAAWAPAGR